MSKKRQCKLAFASVFAVLLMICLSLVVFNFMSAKAEDESVTVTIHGGDNGTVTVSGGEIADGDGSEKTLNSASDSVAVKIKKGENLSIKASANSGYLFQFWTSQKVDSKEKITSAISVKQDDIFSYDELKTQSIGEIYANVVAELMNETAKNNAKLQVSYDDQLGDVYFFMGNDKVTKETVIRHGVHFENGKPIDIAFGLRRTTPVIYNVTLLASPKEDIVSTLDPTKHTKAVFKDWSATYKNGNLRGTDITQSLPYIVDSNSSLGSDFSRYTAVDETWFTPMLSQDTSKNEYDDFDMEKLYDTDYNGTHTQWWTKEFSAPQATIYVKPLTIKANFQEAACVPDINITPSVNGEQKEVVAFSGNETHINMKYGDENSISVTIKKHYEVENQSYKVLLQTARHLATGEFEQKAIAVSDVMDGIIGFNIPDITVNSNIIITPTYDDKYYIEPLIIKVDLGVKDGEDIISDDSETVKIVDETDFAWKFDPQFNSSYSLAFSSGLTYPENITVNSVSQMHFQVTGSGVFMFEFYLDGIGGSSSAKSYAVYGTKKIEANGADTDNFGDNTTVLAQGNTNIGFADVTYNASTIKDSENVSELSNNWRAVTIHVNGEETTTTDIYIAHVVAKNNSTNQSAIDIFRKHTVMAVRNVAFYQGESNVSWGIYGDNNGDKAKYGQITATINGKSAESTSQDNVSSGSRIVFNVSYTESEYKFYGWSDGESLLSTNKEFTYTVHGKKGEKSKTTIYAVITPNNEHYYYRNGGKFYGQNELETALNGAKNSKNNDVIVLESIIISNSIEIPQGVNLVIPFDETYRYYGSDADGDETQSRIAWADESLATANRYLTVTFETNAKISVKGGLYLGGVLNNEGQGYQGHTSGKYSEIINKGSIVIDDGGVMDVYGRVTGGGKIDVMDGGRLYAPFIILDFSGGTNALALFSVNVTPFARYSMINIECPFTINYGAQLIGHASLFALGTFFSLDQPFISYDKGGDLGGDGRGNDTFIMLTEGAKVDITYDQNKVVDKANYSNCTEGIGHTKMVFTGGAKFSYMLFSAAGVSVPTNGVYFSIPYNYEVELNGNNANYETVTDFKIMPGAKVTVGTGATLTLNANTYVYDGLVQPGLSGKSYPTAEQLKNAGYSQSGNLIVNGTLIIGKKTPVPPFDLFGSASEDYDKTPIPAIFLGIVQTDGTTGRIEIGEGSTLNGKIVDGMEGGSYGSNYFAYTTTARVWDKAHGHFANLEAGKAYTATSADEFTLESLKYTTPVGGAKDQTLTLNQQMQGSWQIVHTEHKYTWEEADLESKNATEWESDAKGSPYRKNISHQCSELGCEVSDVKTVVYAPQVQHSENTFQDYNSFIYDGTPWTEEDIKELLTKYYTKEETKARNIRLLAANAQPDVTIKVEGTGAQDGQMFRYGTYNVTITLNDSNYIWLINDDGENRSGVYTFSDTFTFTLEVKAHTLSDKDITVADNVTYKGADFSEKDLNAFVSINGHKLTNEDYTVTITSGDKKNAGKLTLQFSPKGQNVTGNAITKEVTIKQKDVTITAENKNSPEKEDIVDLTATQSGILEMDSQVWEEIQKHLKFTVKKNDATTITLTQPDLEELFKDAKYGDTFTITVGWDDESKASEYAKNYHITFAPGTYTITSAVFKNVKFSDASKEYNGQNQKLEATGTEEGMQCTYTYTAKEGTNAVTETNDGVKNAGTYNVSVHITCEKEGKKYETTLTATLTITKKNVTVTITPQSVEYDGNTHGYTTNGKTWYTVDGLCNGDDITFTATTTAAGKDAKAYDITVTPSGSAVDNYAFTYEGDKEALKITKKVIKVSVKDLTSIYGEAIKDFESTIEGEVVESDKNTINITNYLEYTCEVTTNKNAGTYKITLKTKNAEQLTNYKIEILDSEGTYTISKRDITITIEDQNDMYGYNKNYAWNTDGWTVDTTTLASGDDRSALSIQLVKPAFTVANKYDITATCGNENYNVTFKKGTYTLAKQHIEHNGQTVIFVLQVDGEDFHNETFKFEGKDFVLSATVYVTEKEMISLNYTLNLEKLTKPGSYTVTVTVNDERYEGSAEYAIDILTAEGFSQNLFDVLTKLEKIAGEAEADLLTATEENFALVKAVKAELAKLSEEELEMGEDELVRYIALVETWDDAADIDAGVIESAKALADSPLKWLFVVTQMSSLICALYVIGKGGLLLL